MILGETQDSSTQLAREPTVATEAVCSDLTAGMMPQVLPVDIKFAMVVHMD